MKITNYTLRYTLIECSKYWARILIAAVILKFLILWAEHNPAPSQAVADEVYKHNHDMMIMETNFLNNFAQGIDQAIQAQQEKEKNEAPKK